MASADRPRSVAVPWRYPAKMPSAVPTVKASADASPASSSELPMALPISSATGRPLLIDWPRSPISACFSQSPYCTTTGRSRPYCALTMSMTSCDASDGSTADKGSPGAR